MAAKSTPLSRKATVFAFSLFYSIFMVLHFLWSVVKTGPRKLFRVVRRDIRPDILDDSSFGVHGFARLKTIKLHYVAKGPESKPLMLFLHGYPEFWYSWRHQLKEFGGDYRAVAVDMRGYNESDKPTGIRNYTMDLLIKDVKELIPALGYEKCVLVAHDWGGGVAWTFAQMYPEMVQRLIVCNCPSPRTFGKYVRTNKEQFKKSWYMFAFQMPWLPEWFISLDDYKMFHAMFRGKKFGVRREGSFTDEDIELFKYVFSQPGALTGPLNYYRASMQYTAELKFPAPTIQVPSMMIWGTDDAALSKELAELSRNDVDNYELHFIEGASHWVQQEEPEEVNKLMRNFLYAEKADTTG